MTIISKGNPGTKRPCGKVAKPATIPAHFLYTINETWAVPASLASLVDAMHAAQEAYGDAMHAAKLDDNRVTVNAMREACSAAISAENTLEIAVLNA